MAGFKELEEAVILWNHKSEVTRLVQEEGVAVNCTDSMGRTVLHAAAVSGRMKMIQHLVTLGADINARDRKQWTPLHFVLLNTGFFAERIMAKLFPSLTETCRGKLLLWSEKLRFAVMDMVERKKIRIVDLLFDLGADINAKFNKNVSSLHEAIRRKNVRAVEVLTELGLNGNANEDMFIGLSALTMAVESGEKELIKHLVYLGADVNASYARVPVLHAAVKSGKLKIVQTLLEHGADKNALEVLNITPVSHALLANCNDLGVFTSLAQLEANFNLPYTTLPLLHQAIESNAHDILSYLARQGSDIISSSEIINKPPIVIAFDNDLEVLAHLVHCGVDINAKYDNHISSMVDATRHGKIEMVRALASHGICFEHETVSIGMSALCCFVQTNIHKSNPSNAIRTIEALDRLGADFKATYDGFSVLLDAVNRGDAAMVRELVNLGADMNCVGERGITVVNTLLFSVAVEQNEFHKDVLEILVSAGADVNSGYDSELSLFLAVERSDTRMVETLSSLGANMNKAMHFAKGQGRPVSLACSLNTTEVVVWLLNLGADPNAELFTGAEPLLEALLRSDLVMLKCLLKCGANPMVGKEYRRVRVGDRALLEGEVTVMECLFRAGARISAKVVYGDIELNQKTKRIADSFGIIVPGQPLESFSLINECIMQDLGWDILTMLLTLGANKLCGWNIARITHPTDDDRLLFERVDGLQVPVTNVHSNLHSACLFGNLDSVRLLIKDGSDVHARDTFGKEPFSLLPLASTVDYSTLYETRGTAMVMEKDEMDAEPRLACPRMGSLVCTPGIGDVQFIENPKAAEISEHVEMMMQTVARRCRRLPKIRLRGCGSAAEGTKVGLPDEMDFLAEVDQRVEKEQVYSAGHDYVYYRDPRSQLLRDGSKAFHSCVRSDLFDMAKNTNCPFQGCALRLMPSSLLKVIKDSNRRATSPLRLAWVSRPQTNRAHVSISVDFVPSLHVNDWPDGAVTETWLLGSEALREHGYYIVPKPPHVNSELAEKYTKEQLRVLWKISFPHLETFHMQHLEKRVKDVYLVAKILRNPDVCRIMVTDEGPWPKNVDKYITSYMLKMIFFKNVDEFLHSNLSLEEMVCRVYDQVEEGLSNGFIPLYFMPKVSALVGEKLNIRKCARVAKIMKRFVHALCLRDCQRDQHAAGEDEEVVTNQRKPKSVYRFIEIGKPETNVEELSHTILESNRYARSMRAGVVEWVSRKPDKRRVPGWILGHSS